MVDDFKSASPGTSHTSTHLVNYATPVGRGTGYTHNEGTSSSSRSFATASLTHTHIH